MVVRSRQVNQKSDVIPLCSFMNIKSLLIQWDSRLKDYVSFVYWHTASRLNYTSGDVFSLTIMKYTCNSSAVFFVITCADASMNCDILSVQAEVKWCFAATLAEQQMNHSLRPQTPSSKGFPCDHSYKINNRFFNTVGNTLRSEIHFLEIQPDKNIPCRMLAIFCFSGTRQ